MTSKTEVVKELRNHTSAGLKDCYQALEDSDWDLSKARDLLQQRGIEDGTSMVRATPEGRVHAYVHNGRALAIVEVGCETDFASRSDKFIKFCDGLCLQVCAFQPKYLSKSEAPEGTPDQDCLLSQVGSMIDPTSSSPMTVEEYRAILSSQFGETIAIRRFVRWELGETR